MQLSRLVLLKLAALSPCQATVALTSHVAGLGSLGRPRGFLGLDLLRGDKDAGDSQTALLLVLIL